MHSLIHFHLVFHRFSCPQSSSASFSKKNIQNNYKAYKWTWEFIYTEWLKLRNSISNGLQSIERLLPPRLLNILIYCLHSILNCFTYFFISPSISLSTFFFFNSIDCILFRRKRNHIFSNFFPWPLRFPAPSISIHLLVSQRKKLFWK